MLSIMPRKTDPEKNRVAKILIFQLFSLREVNEALKTKFPSGISNHLFTKYLGELKEILRKNGLSIMLEKGLDKFGSGLNCVKCKDFEENSNKPFIERKCVVCVRNKYHGCFKDYFVSL